VAAVAQRCGFPRKRRSTSASASSRRSRVHRSGNRCYKILERQAKLGELLTKIRAPSSIRTLPERQSASRATSRLPNEIHGLKSHLRQTQPCRACWSVSLPPQVPRRYVLH
jgi:hypothetical protein